MIDCIEFYYRPVGLTYMCVVLMISNYKITQVYNFIVSNNFKPENIITINYHENSTFTFNEELVTEYIVHNTTSVNLVSTFNGRQSLAGYSHEFYVYDNISKLFHKCRMTETNSCTFICGYIPQIKAHYLQYVCTVFNITSIDTTKPFVIGRIGENICSYDFNGYYSILRDTKDISNINHSWEVKGYRVNDCVYFPNLNEQKSQQTKLEVILPRSKKIVKLGKIGNFEYVNLVYTAMQFSEILAKLPDEDEMSYDIKTLPLFKIKTEISPEFLLTVTIE